MTKIAGDMADVLLAGYPPQLAPFHYQWPLEYLKPVQKQPPRDRPEEAAKAAACMLVLRYNEGYQAGHAQASEDARVPKPAEAPTLVVEALGQLRSRWRGAYYTKV